MEVIVKAHISAVLIDKKHLGEAMRELQEVGHIGPRGLTYTFIQRYASVKDMEFYNKDCSTFAIIYWTAVQEATVTINGQALEVSMRADLEKELKTIEGRSYLIRQILKQPSVLGYNPSNVVDLPEVQEPFSR